MVYSDAEKIYVPVFYVLLQNKLQNTYIQALQQIVSACDWHIDATSFTCDFEVALLNSIQQQFLDAKQILCLFHWKQAINQNLEKLGVSKQKAMELTCENGLLNFLTVIPIEEIMTKGSLF
jgi:hypothetical protein